MNEVVKSIPGITYSESNSFFLLGGPCVVEGEMITLQIAERIKRICESLKIPLIFKASYRKANRSKIDSFTGIGDDEALRILRKVKDQFDLPIVTDIHTEMEAQMAAEVADIIQIPAFLARQTELLIAAAKTGKVVNIKKGQFMAPDAMRFAAKKCIDSGNKNIMLTDRGTMFGYQDLIVDVRGIPEMRETGLPVIMDATHSLQQPNQLAGVSGGKPEMIETIARAAISVGADGLFIETHPDPASAKSDGANMLHLEKLEPLLTNLVKIKEVINELN
jgi:2-dehydro-3-deoxyphosphooctonate aldolase (KDO 8-P synthase)